MKHLNSILTSAFVFHAIMPCAYRCLPISSVDSKVEKIQMINGDTNRDSLSHEIQRTNTTDNKMDSAISIRANKFIDSLNNPDSNIPINIPVLGESGQVKFHSDVKVDNHATHTKVSRDEVFHNETIHGESDSTNEIQEISQKNRKQDIFNTLGDNEEKGSKPESDTKTYDTENKTITTDQTESNTEDSSSGKLDTDIQGGEGNTVLEYRVKAGEIQWEEPTTKIVVTVMKRSNRYWEPWELNHNICPPSLCTASEENRPKGTGGSVFFNGDIVLDSESEKHIYGPHSLRVRWKRAASRDSKRLWKDGIVPYTFSDILPKSKRYIQKAMAHIEKHTCIRFRRKKLRDEDYIRFISEPGCWSNVGRVGGEQKVSIGRGCERLGTAVHEITHSLGFWHEQARPDRDKYVKILEDNVSPRYLPDFEPVNKTLVGSRGFPYDYESVMHYSKKAFTNLGEDTIEVIGIGKKLKMKIGQRDMLSNLDIAQLRDMYNCNDKEDDNATVCPSGWKKNGRSCYKFITDLKYQFAAAAKHCQELNSHLLYIENKQEDRYIKKRVKKKFPEVEIWRTGGRKFGKKFAWFTGDGKEPKEMVYTHWKKGNPAGYSSMALVHNRTANRVRWEGVWAGSASQYPQHAYPFICERRAKRKCIKGAFKDGRDYRGTLDHTMDGITCQKWSSQYPHSHKLLPYPYKDTETTDSDGLGDHNYCRNPSKNRKQRPWCFTDKRKIKWQYCDVSICSKSSEDKTHEKQSTAGKTARDNSNKATSPNKTNNKKYTSSSNEINLDIKASNKRTNEIQRDQEDTKQSSLKDSKLNSKRNRQEKPDSGNNNKNNNSKRNSKGNLIRNTNRQNNKRNTQKQNRGQRTQSRKQNKNKNRQKAHISRENGRRN